MLTESKEKQKAAVTRIYEVETREVVMNTSFTRAITTAGLACSFLLTFSIPAGLAESEAGLECGSESGGIYAGDAESESGGPTSVPWYSESGGPFQPVDSEANGSDASSESGGMLSSMSETEAGGPGVITYTAEKVHTVNADLNGSNDDQQVQQVAHVPHVVVKTYTWPDGNKTTATAAAHNVIR